MASVLAGALGLGAFAAAAGAIKVQHGLRALVPNVTAAAGPYWQELRNSIDLQYFGDIKLGEQTIAGVFDTGSFELLVFGERCQTCGKAVGYRHSKSHTFSGGNHSETHSFGSGTCSSEDAYEKVKVGPFTADKFPFWEVVMAQMPVLRQANFQGIVGIGPPGEPVATAKAAVDDADQEAADYNKTYGFIPAKVEEQKKELLEKVEIAKSKLSLLETLGVKTFSVCLGRAPGSSGWLVWNDESFLQPNLKASFQRYPVAGSITWSLQVTNVTFDGLKGTIPLGCQEGCGAIIDTGTSLFALPTKLYRYIYDLLQNLGQDCGDLSRFPDFVLTVGGQELRFGPDAYIGEMTGTASAEVEKYLHVNEYITAPEELPHQSSAPFVQLNKTGMRPRRRRNQCQLLLMDLGDELTQLGPLMILGMPFFREYYTTFDLNGHREGKRELSIAHADEKCEPRSAGSLRKKKRYVRSVDLSKVRVPHLPPRPDKENAERDV